MRAVKHTALAAPIAGQEVVLRGLGIGHISPGLGIGGFATRTLPARVVPREVVVVAAVM
jgi:hypothetical protein